MTLTNHIRIIQNLTETVISYSDGREYEKAHCAVDDIESKCRKLHRHIDQLQLITPRVPRPAGD